MAETSLGLEVIGAARQRLDTPFTHHFIPDICQHGEVTNELCMQKGLGLEGYDCSGLVIASVCDAVGIKPHDWPTELRHARQMASLGQEIPPESGDIVLFAEDDGHDWQIGHVGIHVAGDQFIHASYGADRVVESKVVGVIPVLTVPVVDMVHKLSS